MAINMNIREILPEGAIILDNSAFDNSIIGVTLDGRLIYDYDKMIEEIIEDDGMSFDEAMEWIDYNTIRALPYAGSGAPIIIQRVD